MVSTPSAEALRARARSAAGDRHAAAQLWGDLLQALPGDPEAANALGNIALAEGRAAEARTLFERAVAADSDQPALLFNLAAACRACDDSAAALAALDAALAADPYFVQALFQKAVLLEQAGEHRAAAALFRDFLDTAPPEVASAPRFAEPLAHARRAVAEDDAALAKAVDGLGTAPSRRIASSLAHLTGRAPIYRSEPTFLAVPELPSIPFLERAVTPWLPALEKEWTTIRDEALTVMGERFIPYVANPPGTPLNQWAQLDHNDDWGAFFLWRHGAQVDANCARMPATTALLETLPLLWIDRRGPNAFLSRLAPRTRIPPHHGVTNSRVTVHLPLLVPEGCGFRVGAETRAWRPGEAWVFDDTIEHEAWNDSDEARVILIFDIWHPDLEQRERAHLAEALRAYDIHHGRVPAAGDEF